MSNAFSNDATIPVRPMQVPTAGELMQPITPAIAGLREAFVQGLLTPEQIEDVVTLSPKARKAKAAMFDEQAAQSQASMDVMPSSAALQKARNFSDLDVLPEATKAKKAELARVNTLTPVQTELDNNTLAGALPESRLVADEAKNDPTGAKGLTKTRHAYEALFGVPPTDPQGGIDYHTMQSQLPHMREAMLNARMPIDPRRKEIMDSVEKSYGATGLVKLFDARGPLSLEDMQKVVPTLDRVVKPEQQLGAQARLETLDFVTDEVSKVMSDLKEHPEYFAGLRATSAGQKVGELGPYVGQRGQAAVQNRLKRITAENFLNRIQELRGLGQVRAPELEQIKTTPPTLGLAELKDWENWLGSLNKVIKDGRATAQAVSEGHLPSPSPREGSAPAQQTSPEGLPVISTQEAYDLLKPDTRYVDSAGKSATKR